jgi:2-amino-4-hydroxy-6-hydroxymethyldihydropteridine diphosphokinase
MPQALIALGTNQPCPAGGLPDARSPQSDTLSSIFESLAVNLDAAVNRLAATPGIRVEASSRWHFTKPAGGPTGQPAFLNGAVRIETDREPLALLDQLQAMEHAGGRQRLVHWGPRTIDLDLLLYDDRVLASPRLELPHPRLGYRRFVLEPAAEVAADWRHPLIGWTISQLARHAANPLNLVVVLGQDRAAIATIIAKVLTRVPGDWLRDPDNGTRLPPSEIASARRVSLIEAARAATLSSRPLLCDFWPFDVHDAPTPQRLEDRALPTPKLKVGIIGRRSFATGAWSEGRRASLEQQGDTEPGAASELEDDRLRRWLTRPKRGPWLLLEAGAVDAGAVDAGAVEAGAVDAGAFDDGAFDAGATDAAAEELAGAIESFR